MKERRRGIAAAAVTAITLAASAQAAPPTAPVTVVPRALGHQAARLTYLPPSSPVYPDHLLMIANRVQAAPPFIEASIEVVRPGGKVAAQIFPASPLRESYLTGIALEGTDRILVGVDDELWTIDFMGNILAGPVTTPAALVEGIGDLARLNSTGPGRDRCTWHERWASSR